MGFSAGNTYRTGRKKRRWKLKLIIVTAVCAVMAVKVAEINNIGIRDVTEYIEDKVIARKEVESLSTGSRYQELDDGAFIIKSVKV